MAGVFDYLRVDCTHYLLLTSFSCCFYNSLNFVLSDCLLVRYLAFAGDELWTHTGVVVKHSMVRNGVPNQETGKLLTVDCC